MAKRKAKGWNFKTGEDVAAAVPPRRPPAVPKAPAKFRRVDGRPVRIEIPDWRPMLANEWAGQHWSVLQKGKKQAAQFIGVYAMAAGLKFVRHDFRAVRSIDIELQVPPGREVPDPDALLKVTLDACKLCRVIVEDSPAWCKWDTPRMTRGPILKLILTVKDLEIGPPIDPADDKDVKRTLTILTKRIEKRNKRGEKINEVPAAVPPEKRRVPRLG